MQCCDPLCLKWRRLPPGTDAADPAYEEDWFCDMNPDPKMAAAGHDAPQEIDEVSAHGFRTSCSGCGAVIVWCCTP